MSFRKVVLPKTAADLLNPARMADLERAVELMNAFQNLKLIIRSGGQSVVSAIQISGQTATLSAKVNIGLDPETVVWIARAREANGTFGPFSIQWANSLIIAIKATSYNSKIKYLLPFLGSNLATARVPLRDSLGVGIAANTGFVDADFNESRGLQGNGSSKILSSLVRPSQLGSSTNGGIGWWENNINLTGNVEPMGCYGNGGGGQERFVLDIRSSFTRFVWSLSANGAAIATAGMNAHYYGQRSAPNVRQFFTNGTILALNTTVDAGAGAADNPIGIVGSYEGVAGAACWPGRGACAYMTDGTMTIAEVTAFNSLLQAKLISPTGRG